MTRPILFAGPTLWGVTLPAAVDVRPPAQVGDLLRAAAAHPAAIGLIDGVFETGPSVWHKEILAVLAAGVPVLGAASLGALRAAELDGEGMIGVGTIYAAYREERLTRDDAVMVSHAPAALGFRPLSVALVDAEAAIRAAALTADDRALLLRVARRLGFRERSWPVIAAAFARVGRRPMPAIDKTISLKRDDALALVTRLSEPPAPPETAPPPETVFLRALRERVGGSERRPPLPAPPLPSGIRAKSRP